MPIKRSKPLYRQNVNQAIANLARRRKFISKETPNQSQEVKKAINRWIANGKKDIQKQVRKRKTGITGLKRILSDQRVTERLFRMKKFQATKTKK